MEPLVSVIVPVYNAAEYIERCVHSIVNQVYRNIELILVDDGSSDGTADLLDSYAKADPRIVVSHRENAGVSASRNHALDLARGEYVQFADSDDWLTPDSTMSLVRAAVEKNCDLVIADFYRVSGKKLSQKGDIDEDGVMNRVEFASCMVDNPADFYYGVLWNKLYRRSIIEEHQLRMDTSISWCEDFLFNLEYIRWAETFYALQLPVYYYVKRRGSLVSKSSSAENGVKMKLSLFECYDSLYRDVYGENYDEVKQKVKRFLVDAAKDGIVVPLPGSNYGRLGEEHPEVIRQAAAGNAGLLTDIYCLRKLLECYLNSAALLKKTTLEELLLLLLFRNVREFRNTREIAVLADLTPQKTAAALQRLKHRGLVETFTSDRGAVNIELGEKSKDYIEKIEQCLDELRSACLSDLSGEEEEQLRALLPRLRGNLYASLDKMSGGSWE